MQLNKFNEIMVVPKDPIYYECHITTNYYSPESEEKRYLEDISSRYLFKVASFSMVKPNENDCFITGRSKSFWTLHECAGRIVEEMQQHSIEVRRVKIESVLVDAR